MPDDSNRQPDPLRYAYMYPGTTLASAAARPARLYYGWAVLLVAAAAMVGTLPGRTQGLGMTITGARIVDGSGSPPRPGSVRVEGDRIVAVGTVAPAPGDAIVDGKSLTLAPGFIDIHNHSASGLTQDPAAETLVAQGITTLVVGADGSSPWPIAAFLADRRKSPAAVNVMVMVASDGGIGLRHPRSAGTFPRVLGDFVRERHWSPLQDAIHKMTGALAARLKLADRGAIAVGNIADLVLFDPATIADRSTFQDPFVLATGVKGVWVNGIQVWDGAKATGATPGRMLAR